MPNARWLLVEDVVELIVNDADSWVGARCSDAGNRCLSPGVLGVRGF